MSNHHRLKPLSHPVNRPPQHPPINHAHRCLWFWAWATVGAAGALGLVSLGPIALGPAIIVGAAITRSPTGRRLVLGAPAGAGLLCLFIAYLQRQGPGTTCWHTATASGCDQHLDPVPWLLIGLLFLLGASVMQIHRAADSDDVSK
jgi:hypothetical protein